MWTEADIAMWSAWADVLTADEHPRLAEYLELYEAQLRLLHEGEGRPEVTTRYAAMRRSAVIWDYARLTRGMRAGALARRQQRTRGGERAELLSESEMRRRLHVLCMDELEAASRFAEAARGTVEEPNVVPLPTRKRRTG